MNDAEMETHVWLLNCNQHGFLGPISRNERIRKILENSIVCHNIGYPKGWGPPQTCAQNRRNLIILYTSMMEKDTNFKSWIRLSVKQFHPSRPWRHLSMSRVGRKQHISLLISLKSTNRTCQDTGTSKPNPSRRGLPPISKRLSLSHSVRKTGVPVIFLHNLRDSNLYVLFRDNLSSFSRDGFAETGTTC